MANSRIKGITIEIDGNTTKLTKALAQVNREVTKTQSALKDVDKLLKIDPGNTDLLAQKQKYLSDGIEATKNKLKEEKAALEQLKNAPGTDENIKAQDTLQREIAETEQNLKNLTNEYKNFGSVGAQQAKVVGDKMQEVGGKMSSMGSTLTRNVTVPIATAFGASLKAAVDWETAFTGVKKTVDATDEEFAQLAENIKKMATETASSKEEIAGVMEIAGQLGITGVDGLTTFTKTMIELGDTTNLTAEEAATSLARFMNITGESATDVDKIGSAVVDLGNNFATSESEIVEMATRLASAGTIAGMSSTDILALAAAMSSVGIQAEAGGTAMSQTLKTMANAVANFKDGEADDLEFIAGVANTSAEEFAKSWENDPVKAMEALVKGLAQVKDEGDNVFDVLGQMGMTGVRQTNMIQSLALASDMLADAVNTSSDAYAENTALSEEAEKRYETMAAKMSQLKERFKDVAISIGEILMPYIEKLMGFVEGLIEKWNGLSDAQKDLVVKIAGIAAVAGPALVVIGQIVGAFGSILSAAPAIQGAFSTLSGTIGGLGGALGALPILGVIAEIGLLVAAIKTAYDTDEVFRTEVNEAWAEISESFALLQQTFSEMGQTIVEILNNLGFDFQNFSEVVKAAWEAISQAIANTQILPLLERIKAAVVLFSNEVSGVFGALSALLRGDWAAAWEYFSSAVKNIVETVITYVAGRIPVIGGYLKSIIDMLFQLKDAENQAKSAASSTSSGSKTKKYASAMNGGTILKGATIFGAQNGQYLQAGEAGPEVVVGANSLSSMIRSSMPQTDMVQLSNVISSAVGSALQNYGISIDVTANQDGLFKSIQQSNAQYKKMHGGLGALT